MVRLPADRFDLVRRVEEYCAQGLGEPQIARAEGLALGTLLRRLLAAGFVIEKETTRRVVRTGSGEPLSELLETGQIVIAQEAEPVEAVAA